MLKNDFKIVYFFIFWLLLGIVNAEENSVDSLFMNATISSGGIDRSISSIQSSFIAHSVNEDDSVGTGKIRWLRLEELKKIADEIKEKKIDMKTYEEHENSELAKKSAEEIIEKSNMIYAYECLFQLDFEVERLKGFKIDQEIRLKDTQPINYLLRDAELLLFPQYRITLGKDKIASTYLEYYEKCELKKEEISEVNSNLKEESGLTDIGFIGNVLLAITLSFFGFFLSYHLTKEVQEKVPENIITVLFWIFIVIFGLWGLFITSFNSIEIRFATAAFAGLIVLSLFCSLLEKIGNRLGSRNKHYGKISIEKLDISKDYKELLTGAGISSVEELLKEDIKDLSEKTGLQIETLIRFRDIARRVSESEADTPE